MKRLFENWRKFINEGEVIVGPWKDPMAVAIEEFQQIFGDHYDGDGYNSGPDEVEIKDFIHHLETKQVEQALKAIGYRPSTLGMDQLGEIYMWVDKWFDRKNML